MAFPSFSTITLMDGNASAFAAAIFAVSLTGPMMIAERHPNFVNYERQKSDVSCRVVTQFAPKTCKFRKYGVIGKPRREFAPCSENFGFARSNSLMGRKTKNSATVELVPGENSQKKVAT